MMILLFHLHPQGGKRPNADESCRFSGRTTVGWLLSVIHVETEVERLSQEMMNHDTVGRV